MSTEQLNQNIQGKENPQDIWIKPNYFNELGEIKRTAKTFAKDDNELYTKILTNFEKQLPLAELEPLTDEIWTKLENTDSYHDIQINSFEKLAELSKLYNRKWKDKLQNMKNNHQFEAPIIFEMNGVYHKVSGNTRLMVARTLGLRPKAIFIKFNSQDEKNN